MVTNKDFVVTGLQHWNLNIGFNAKDISLELAKNNRVLFVNTPLDFITSFRGEDSEAFRIRKAVLRKEIPALRQVEQNLWVVDMPFTLFPVNIFKNKTLFDFVNRENNRKMFSFVKRNVQKLKFGPVIHFNDNDLFRSFYAKEFLSPSLEIYYRRDNLLSVEYWRHHGTRLEPLLAAKSDLVVANSIQLADAVREFNPNTYDIGQGVDLSGFDITHTRTVPEDMAAIPSPRVGYVGYITALRLDADLIYNLAQKMPAVNFVMVGPEDAAFCTHAAHNLPNVHFLGNKPMDKIPDYIASLDICLNPQVVNDVTRGNYPRKIDEYLALGKPVVATDTPTMQLFSKYVTLCHTTQEYADAIHSILASDSVQNDGRIAFAQEHSWENSVHKLYKLIDPFL